MAITIQGDNKGIAVGGNLTIEKLDFVFGQGVRSASGVKQDIPEADVVEAEKPICVALNSSQRQIVEAAEQNGIIVYNRAREGYDTGHKSSNALVAYLCGCLFCGDSTNSEGQWVSGSRFDDAKYCKELFGFDVAGTRRSTQGNGAGKSPIGYERVDKLFE